MTDMDIIYPDPKFSLWDGEIPKRFNHCYVLNYANDEWTQKLQEIRGSSQFDHVKDHLGVFGTFGQDWMLASIPNKAWNMMGNYDRWVAIYTVNEDWRMIERLTYPEEESWSLLFKLHWPRK